MIYFEEKHKVQNLKPMFSNFKTKINIRVPKKIIVESF